MNTLQNKSSGASGGRRNSLKRILLVRFKLVLCIVLLILAIGHQKIFGQGVGISELAPINPHASSILELQSTTKGFLAPRMSTAQRTGIASPAQGLMVYDTDTKSFWYWDSTWKAVPSSTIAWGTANQLLGMNAAGNANEYKTLNGSINITVAHAAGSITLNTIQDITTTSSPLFAGLSLTSPLTVLNGGTGLQSGISGGIPYFSTNTTMTSSALLTANGVVIGGGAGTAPFTIIPGTNNTVLRGSTGGAPSFGQIVNGDIAAGTIDLGSKVTGILPLTNGGTNANLLASASNGGIVWSNATQMQILAGTTTANKILLSGASSSPAWSTYTIPPSFAGGGEILYTSNATTLSNLAAGTSGMYLKSNGTAAPAWQRIDLSSASEVMNVLPITNGGTNSGMGLNNDRFMISSAGKIIEAPAMVNGQVIVGSNGLAPQVVTMSGEATIDNAGSLSLSATGVTAGSYGDATHVGNYTVDSKGRLTFAGSTLITGTAPGGAAGGDLSGNYPNPTVSKINGATLGTTSATNNHILVADGSQWNSVALSNDATIDNLGLLTLANTTVTAGSYGDATHVGNYTVDSKGRLTFAGSTLITGTAPGGAAGGDLSGNYPNPTVSKINGAILGTTSATNNHILVADGSQWNSVALSNDATIDNLGLLTLANTTVTAGSYGDATHVGNYTVDSKGRLTFAGSTLITGTAPGGAAGGDLSGTYPDPTVSKINGALLGTTTVADKNILVSNATSWNSVAMSGDATIGNTGVLTFANTAVTPGNYGDGSHVATFTVNSKGQLTFANNTLITGTSPVGSALTNGHIWVGDISNLASEVMMNGDATMTNAGIVTVGKIKGATLGSTTATDNNILVADGLQWNSVALSNDATISNTGLLTLATTGVTAASYGTASAVPTISIDAKGRVMTASNIAISIPASAINNATIAAGSSLSNSNTGDETTGTIKTKLGAASAIADGYLTMSDWNVFNSKQAALGYTPEDVANKVSAFQPTPDNNHYPSEKLVNDQLALKAASNQTFYLGTTQIAINRVSGAQALTGITSIDGNATTAGTATNLAGGSLGTIPYQSGAGATAMSAVGSAGQVLTSNGAAAPSWTTPTTGTVTSVGLSLPAFITVTNSPVTGSGTLTGTLINQAANTFFAAPDGSVGVPGFRALVAADIPVLDWTKIATGKPTTLAGYGITDAALATHNHTIDGLFNVTITGKANNDILQWNGSAWVNKTLSGAGIITSETDPIVKAINGIVKSNGTTISAASAGSDYSAGTSALATGIVKSTTGTGALTIALAGDFPILNQNTTGNATTATTATNIAGGISGTMPYQSAAGTTLMTTVGTAGQVLTSNGGGAPTWSSPTIGTVTSVGLTLPAFITVSGSPVTGSGTLTGTLASQSANMVFAAPNGSAGAPIFRSLAAADIPNIAESQVTNLVADLSNRALTSTTVNGHALSANVVVSASDITTGTLPHAQLPALVSGDIPNNGANTTGNAATAATATTATNAINTAITNDVATATSVYPTWVTANTGNLPQTVSSTKLSFIPSTGILTATGFAGPLTGNATAATTATNIAGGISGTMPYQSAAGTTLMTTVGTAGQVLTSNGGGAPTWSTPTTGTVTSVGLTLPAFITVSGSPVTGSGTLTGTLASQSANMVFAAPNGSAGAPIFRSLAAADIPNIAESQVTNLVADLSNRALTSTTVNGHALSANVVVSASDITTGTLPHAQLPALVSGDIPNNGANTTGNAATATSATNATNATTATNLANGANGSIPYQSGSDATAFIAAGSTGQILRSAGAGAPTWSTAVYPAAAGTAGNTLRSNGTDFVSTPVNGHSFTPADPGNTASGAGVMMGLGSTITFTPARSGIVLIIISGSTNNSTNGNYGTAIQLRYNTGSAPNYNTALTGTTAGVQLDVSGIGSTTRWYPFTINAVVSSLTVGSAYWIDLSLATIVGGTASIRDLNVSVVEL